MACCSTPPNTTGLDGVELVIMIIATFGQAVSGQGPCLNIVSMLIVWRLIVSVLVSYFKACGSTEREPISLESGSEVTTP